MRKFPCYLSLQGGPTGGVVTAPMYVLIYLYMPINATSWDLDMILRRCYSYRPSVGLDYPVPVGLLAVTTKDRPLSVVPIYVDYYTDL